MHAHTHSLTQTHTNTHKHRHTLGGLGLPALKCDRSLICSIMAEDRRSTRSLGRKLLKVWRQDQDDESQVSFSHTSVRSVGSHMDRVREERKGAMEKKHEARGKRVPEWTTKYEPASCTVVFSISKSNWMKRDFVAHTLSPIINLNPQRWQEQHPK